MVRCVLGLTEADSPAVVTLGSRYGNLPSAMGLLEVLTTADPPSPMAFSHSVLNAGCGVANQIRKDRSPHAAVSAGANSLDAALTDACLSAGDTLEDAAHIVVLADVPLPEVCEGLDEEPGTEICIGLRVSLATNLPPSINGEGAAPQSFIDANMLLTHLKQGKRSLRFEHGHWSLA